jgi:hypothetical protein
MYVIYTRKYCDGENMDLDTVTDLVILRRYTILTKRKKVKEPPVCPYECMDVCVCASLAP